MLAVSKELYKEGKEYLEDFEDKKKLLPFGMIMQMAFRQQIKDTKDALKFYEEAEEKFKDYWYNVRKQEVARLIMLSDMVGFEEDVCNDCLTHIWELGEEEDY